MQTEAGSVIRQAFSKRSSEIRFSFSQNFIPVGYKELAILPKKDGGFKMEKEALHIWPRGKFMVIALPNQDGSYTVTAFFPFEGENGFDNLDSDEKVMTFFKKYFPDLTELMPNLLTDWHTNRTSALGHHQMQSMAGEPKSSSVGRRCSRHCSFLWTRNERLV